MTSPVAFQKPAKMAAIIILVLSCGIYVWAEHSGAYSSPQYAKKMFPIDDKFYQGFESNALPLEKPPIPFKRADQIDYSGRFNSNDTSQYGRSSLLETAGSLLSSAGGQMMTNLAKDFIARSTGSSQVGFDCISQVLSLNLTNLVILVVLKALILAAGFFGAGAWKGHQYARSIDDKKNASYITEDEILLYLTYLAGQQNQDFSCLYKLSCQRPHQAGLYSSGAQLLLQGARLINGNSLQLDQYEDISNGIKKAASWGEEGMSCDRYQCPDS